MSIFSSEQYAISIADSVASALSSLQGQVFFASLDSTFVDAADPKPECMYESYDGFSSMKYLGPVAPGDLKIRGLNLAEVEIPPQADQSFAASGHLSEGDYEVETTGTPNSYGFTQGFHVPKYGSDISISSGQAAAQKLPSPAIPAPTAADYTVTFKRSENLFVSFTPPEDADYVRVKINDGYGRNSVNPYGNIVCYGALDKPLGIPKALFEKMQNGNKGYIWVDFVSVRLDREIPHLKEAFFKSYVRHMHGYVIVPDGQGGAAEGQIGVLQITD
jgi:hypothetical protein